jgi:hypothetical protein
MTRTPTTEDLDFYNKALDGNAAGNNRGGSTVTGSTIPASPRRGGHREHGADFESRMDNRTAQQWLRDGMPEPWDLATARPEGMTLFAYEHSARRVDDILRALEPQDRLLIETCMAFKTNDNQAAKYLGLPRITYRDRLNKARERAKTMLVKFYEWGDEPSDYTERLNEIRRSVGAGEFKVRNDRVTALAAYKRHGTIRAAARELNMSKSSLQRLLNAA